MKYFKLLFITILALTLLMGCKKADNPSSSSTTVVPVLTTTDVTSITKTTAISGGNITSDGGSAVTARGICWGTNQNPTITASKTSDASGTGSFTSAITGLTENTTYYVRAYATNSSGTAYGNSLSFKTLQQGTTPTWTKLASSNYPALIASKIQFVDANNGFVGITPFQTTTAVVARTTDGGVTWTNLSANCPSGNNFSSYWVNATTGYLSVSKDIYKSIDAGNSWTKVGFVAYATIVAMCFTDVNTGYLVGNNDLTSYKTTDGGVTWKAMGTLFAAYSMRFANATKGYACGSYNLGVTSDGAATWKLSFFAGKVFRDISVVDANTAYAVGDQGLMKKTTDGGVTWSDVPHNIPPGTYNTGFNSVYFTSASEGWVTADVGIYHTIDAGLTWTQELSLIGSHYAIWMINNNKGFMCSVTSGGSMYVYGSGN